MKNKIFFFILLLSFLIAFALRFYKLGEIPNGFYQDESAIGYNALSLIETGKDEHGKKFSLYFKSFGDYKLPVYIYSAIVPIKIFGLNEFSVRFPSAFFGFLSVVVFYFLIKEITENKKLSLVATMLLAVNPWSLHYNRAAFEISISMFLFISGSLFLFKSFKKKKFGFFLFGTICFILSLYSYNLTRLLSPALYLLILGLNLKNVKEIRKKELIITTIISFIFLIPFLSSFLQKGGFSSASGTLIFSSSAVLAPMLELKSYFINFPAVSKLFFNINELILFHFFQNIISYFSMDFLFISGSAHGNHGIGNVGQLYLFEFPLIIIAFVKIIREKIKWSLFLFLWLVIVVSVASLTREVPHATRSFFLVFTLEVFSAFGLMQFLSMLRDKKNLVKFAIFFIFTGFISYNLIYYFASYYIRFPILYAKSWRSSDKALSLYIKDNQQKYDRIIFDKNSGFIYSSLLFYLNFSPYEFQKTAVRELDDSEGFSMVRAFDKYEFKDIDWKKDYESDKKTLIITTADGKPKEIPPLKTFYYPKRPVVFSVKQEVVSYPIEEIAYVLVENK